MSVGTISIEPAQSLEITQRLDRASQIIRLVFCLLATSIAAFLTWTARFSMNPDGMSYLDIADNYLRKDWSSAVNAYWSPLYSWILAIGLRLLRPSPRLEFSAIQLINFVIFLLTLWSFDIFWCSLYRQTSLRSHNQNAEAIPRWAWLAMGYSLFIWTIARAVLASEVTPDLLVAAIIYLVCAVLVRIRGGDRRLRLFVLHGLLLGLGYLAKSAMFPLGFVFLVAAFFAARGVSGRLPRVLAASLMFFLVSGPFIFVISRSHGRFTFGESGRLGYAWVVNRSAPFFNWQGADPAGGVPKHPTKKLLSAPDLYEFKSPVRATYPPHYDPSYWNEGLTPHFHLGSQIRVLFTSAYACYDLLVRPLAPLIAIIVILVVASDSPSHFRRQILATSYLWLPALAALAMYALITIEARYVAAFLITLFAAFLSSIRLMRAHNWTRLLVAATLIAVVSLTLEAAEKVAIRAYESKERSVNSSWLVADALTRLGIQQGDRVVSLGSGYNAYWARLARINIVAEIPTNDVLSFWASDDANRSRALALSAGIGAKAVVTPQLPEGVPESGWRRLGNTNFFVYLLPSSEPSRNP